MQLRMMGFDLTMKVHFMAIHLIDVETFKTKNVNLMAALEEKSGDHQSQ